VRAIFQSVTMDFSRDGAGGDLITCEHCAHQFGLLATSFGEGTLFRDCLTICPNCWQHTTLPMGTVEGGKFVNFYRRLFDELAAMPNPAEVATELSERLAAARANEDVDEALAAIDESPLAKAIREFLPQDRKERQDFVWKLIDVLLKILPIIISTVTGAVTLMTYHETHAHHEVPQRRVAVAENWYQVVGVERSTVFPTIKRYKAASPAEARDIAERDGIVVSSVTEE
jgi:hypothetical protein